LDFFIYNFFMFFQILLLFFLFLISLSFIKNSFIRKLSALIFSLFVLAELISIYIGGALINYKFYLHANLNDIWVGASQFILQALVFILGTLFIYFVLIKISNLLTKSQFKGKKVFFIFSFVLLSYFILFRPNSIGSNIYEIYKILNVKKIAFNQALKDLGINPKKYKTPKHIKASKGKNIIIISMESLEKGFLNEKFKKVTPNLQKLTRELTYFKNMPQGPGSGWTIASLYTFMTGVPALIPGKGNEVFKNLNEVKLTGLGHIFKKAGYKSDFLISEADFAGTRNLVKAYQINVIDRDDMKSHYKDAPWGLYDYDLFQEAKKYIKNKKSKQEKFALILSTISTHPPHGVVDERMKNKLPEGLSNHEFSIATLDYLIGDLIKYLKENNLYKNTAIYIFPDHQLMGLGSDKNIFDRLGNKRGLYMITNIDSTQFSKSPNEQIYQIDLPKLIIEGSGIQTNAVFLTDFIKTKDKISFLKNKGNEIAQLNKVALTKDNFSGDLIIQREGDFLIIKADEGNVKFPIKPNKKRITKELIFDNDMSLLKINNVEFKDLTISTREDNYLHLIISVKDNLLFVYLGDKEHLGISKKGISEIKLDSKIIDNVLQSISVFPFQTKNKKINNKKLIVLGNLMKITSSNYVEHKTVPTQVVYNHESFPFKRGLNVIYHIQSKDTVISFDTHASTNEAKQLIELLQKLQKMGTSYVMFAYDSAANKIKEIKEELKCLGFFELLKIKNRQPYIAFYNNDILEEYTGNETITVVLPWNMNALPQADKITISQKRNWRTDKSRFIAHAGGEINGKRYTNSLEALNENYTKGFRMFELDIIKSSDGKYIAEHDWKHWISITNYKGHTPVNSLEFKKYKKYGKYTPLEMADINEWFKNHPDAILVTDKVQNPEEFASKFIDKNRLIMEIFSLDDAKKALKINKNIVMAGENIFKNIKGDKVSFFKKLGINKVAISRKKIAEYKEDLIKLKNNNIKVYIYHVNFGKGFDEEYVLNNEFKYVYGMYADKWDFNKEQRCKR